MSIASFTHALAQVGSWSMSLETFLADLDDLNEEEGGGNDEYEFEEEEDDNRDEEDDDLDMLAEDPSGPKAASGLLTSPQMAELMERIETAMATQGAGRRQLSRL